MGSSTYLEFVLMKDKSVTSGGATSPHVRGVPVSRRRGPKDDEDRRGATGGVDVTEQRTMFTIEGLRQTGETLVPGVPSVSRVRLGYPESGRGGPFRGGLRFQKRVGW